MGQLVLVAPPYLPFAPALQAAGIDAKRLCAVQPGRSAQDLAWACEQALHCRDVLAVLAWLPELPRPRCAACSWLPLRRAGLCGYGRSCRPSRTALPPHCG
jgi:hypothetical protein